ncbi:MAG: helix-turn-helix transcriptional regulator, partial [Clostridiales bacterium]|nr:helix-turn-helix transcriptional regulator [Clostridiales bacterium]
MKNQLSIQEKLEDLRKERGLKQDVVATAVGITISTLSKYENKDNKAYNLDVLAKLAKYYDVSLEWLAGNTEVREVNDTEIDELKLDDATIELLKSGQFNRACEEKSVIKIFYDNDWGWRLVSELSALALYIT